MTHRFTFFVMLIVVVTLLPEVVICCGYLPSWPAWTQWAYAFTIAWAVFAIVVMQTWILGHVRSIRFFFATFLLLTIPKLLFAILAPPLGAVVGLVAGALFFLAALYGFLWGWRRLVTTHVECVSPTLPAAFDGYRIVQLSDLHLGSLTKHPDFIKRIVETANAQHPDLIVFTGDLVNHTASEAAPFTDSLSRLSAPDGVLSIFGNHDELGTKYAKYMKPMHEKMGWRVLMNEHVLITRGDDSIAVVGVETTSPPPFKSTGDLGKALEGIPSDMWKLLLTHDPSHWRREVLDTTDIPLTLSGHTHSAHLRLLGWSPARLMYHEWGGTYHEGGRMLHVSSGICGTVVFRLGAWPEVNVITLKKS